MKITDEFVANIRSSIREHLRLLADPVAQREYERNVPVADVPAELLCGWCDDVYHPASAAFQSAFSPRELAALAEFDNLFNAAAAELPDPLLRLRELQAHPAWGRVMSGAATALQGVFGPAV